MARVVVLFVSDIRVGDVHKGTHHKLFSNTRVTRDPDVIIRYPPKVGSLSLTVAKSTFNPTLEEPQETK